MPAMPRNTTTAQLTRHQVGVVQNVEPDKPALKPESSRLRKPHVTVAVTRWERPISDAARGPGEP